MALQYQLKEGNYHLYDLSTPPSKVTGEHRLRLKTDTVAIAFDASTGMLHEHGSPLRIHSWATTARRRLRAACSRDWPRCRTANGWRAPDASVAIFLVAAYAGSTGSSG